MFGKLIEFITGRDDVERVAYKGDIRALNEYLKTRRLLIPRRPTRFLDASNFTDEELLEMIEKESIDLDRSPFEPWVLEMDGKRRLPAFSSQKKFEVFSGRISIHMNKVFALGGGEMLIEDVAKAVDIDFVDLNLFSDKRWEIGLQATTGGGAP